MNIINTDKKKYISQKASLSNTINGVDLSKITKNTKYNKFNNMKDLRTYFKDKSIKYNLENRLFYYENIMSKIVKISNKECLDVILPESTELVNYNLKNIITLIKRIGTDSKYGAIYIASIKDEIGKRPIAAKLMKQNYYNIRESELNKKISNIVITKKFSRHFILTYKVIKCDIISDKKIPEIISNNKYFILLNELARGDLKHLCRQSVILKNDKLMFNILIQIILSVLTFHNLGYTHRDCHWGNFLYHYNDNITGYYHYNINEKDYYLKACKYSMYIYDFGRAIPMKISSTYNIHQDYTRILGAFINQNVSNKDISSWLGTIKIPPNLPTNKFSNFVMKFNTNIHDTLYEHKNKENEIKLIVIADTIIKTFLSYYSGVFTNIKPKQSNIINSTPYYINNNIKI